MTDYLLFLQVARGPVWLRLMLWGFRYTSITVRVGQNGFEPTAPRTDKDKKGDYISLRLDLSPFPGLLFQTIIGPLA